MLRSLILTTLSLALAAQAPAPAPAAAAAAKAPVAAPSAPKAAVAPAAAEAPKEDKVLATIGKETIKESDFEVFLTASLSDQQRKQMTMMPGARDQYLKRFLDCKVLAGKARKEGMAKAPDFAKKMVIMEMQTLIQALFERDGELLKKRTSVKDEDVKAYFEKHTDKFMTPETFSARHILVGTRAQGKDKPARTDEEAQARIKAAQEALKAGKTFDEVAKEFSDDPGSKDKGGLYENMAFGRFVPEFDKAVRTQELGKVGEPVKSSHGYHLILAEKINPSVPKTFENAKEQAKQLLLAENQEKVMADYLNAAKAEIGYAEGSAPAKPATRPKGRKGAK